MRVEGGSRCFLWPKEAGPQCHVQRVSCRSWHRPCSLLKVSELEISRLGRNLDQVSLGFEVCVWGGGCMVPDERERNLCLDWGVGGLGAGNSIKSYLYVMGPVRTTQPSHLLAQYTGGSQ